MYGYIYGLIDPRDNLIKYVGQTRFNINKRYHEHLRNSKYKSTKYHNVYCWINELNNENLLPIIIEIENIDVLLLNEREKYWVDYYGKQLKNMTKGGNGIKFINKKPFTIEHKNKIGDSCRGNKHYNYGKSAHNIKAIYKFNKITGLFLKEYNSIKEASIDVNISQSAISLCLTGKRNSSKEYIWIYKDDYENNKSLINEKILKCINNPSNITKSISIKQIDINTNEIIKIHFSIREAARSINSSDSAIHFVCKKSKSHIYKNFRWEII